VYIIMLNVNCEIISLKFASLYRKNTQENRFNWMKLNTTKFQ